MMSLIPKRKQWKTWSLPSKLTAIGTFIGILSFGFYLIEKGHLLLESLEFIGITNDVHLVVEFDNQSSKHISLYGRGETFFWYPGGGEHKIYAFEVVSTGNKESYSSNISIPKESKVHAVIRLLPKTVARSYLEQGHMSLSLFFKGINGDNKFSPTIGFSKEHIKTGYISIVFENQKS